MLDRGIGMLSGTGETKPIAMIACGAYFLVRARASGVSGAASSPANWKCRDFRSSISSWTLAFGG